MDCLFLKLHRDIIRLLQLSAVHMGIHEHDVRPAFGAMQSSAVFVADIAPGQVGHRRVIEFVGQVRDQKSFGRTRNGT